MSTSQNTDQHTAVKVEKIQLSNIQNDIEYSTQPPLKRKNKINNKSYSNLSQGALTPTSPFYQKAAIKSNQNQNYSQTIKKIFKTINQNKQEDLRLDSQFTRTCTNIKSLRSFTNFFQSKIEGQQRSSSYNNLNYMQQPSTPQTNKSKNNVQDYQGQSSSTIINNMPSQSQFNIYARPKDNNTSLEQNKEQQIPQEINKLQMFKTYQNQYSKRNSVGGGKINWMNFKYQNQRRSQNISIENVQQLCIKNYKTAHNIQIDKQQPNEKQNNSQQNQNNLQILINNKDQECTSNVTTNNSLSKQINNDDIMNTPNQKNSQSSSFIFSSKNKRSSIRNNKIYSNDINNYLGKFKQMNLNSMQNNYKISTFSDFSRLENFQKKQQNEYQEQNQTHTPSSSKNLSLQNRISQDKVKQYFYSPVKPCYNNFTSSLNSIYQTNNTQQSNKQTIDQTSPINNKRSSEDSKRETQANTLDGQDLTTKSQNVNKNKEETIENQQELANVKLNTSPDEKLNNIQEQSQTASFYNKNTEKLNFKKTQIFQTKQKIKTKEIKVYDDSFKLQRRSSKGKGSLEFIQLPFFRKKVVVIPNNGESFYSVKVNQSQQSVDQTQKNNKNQSTNLQHINIPYNHFRKFGEHISSQQQINQSFSDYFNSPISNYKYHNQTNFSSNLKETERDSLLQNLKQLQLQKGANILKLKEALKSNQSDTIMGLISPENKYQTNLYSKKYEQFIQKKR